jgi:hypothetical protein
MKKIIAFSLLLILFASSFSQEAQPAAPLTRADYLKKSKTQKTVAFIFLGAGALTIISVSGGNTDFNTLGPLVVLGSVLTLSSIPLFIASGRNKRKAANASLGIKFEKKPMMQQTAISFQSLPALSFKLRL